MTSGKPLIESRKNYHHGDLKGQLLEAVRQLVEDRGPDDFSIAEACRRAGVSTAAPYKHFSDRHEIMRGVAHLALERMRAGMQAAADAHRAGDPARIVALGRSYVDFARREPGVFAVMFGLTGDHGDDENLTMLGQSCFEIVVDVVADHMTLDPMSEEAFARAYALWCFVHGHAFLCLDGKADTVRVPLDETRLLTLVGAAIVPG